MNVKRFTGRTAREAMQKVRLAFGDDAVVLSNKPCSEGVEIVAMPGDAVESVDELAAPAQAVAQHAIALAAASAVNRPSGNAKRPPLTKRAESSLRERIEAEEAAAPSRESDETTSVQDDLKRLSMSTLSFQDYVRERLLKRRQAVLSRQVEPSFDMEAARQEPPAQALASRLAQRVAQREGQAQQSAQRAARAAAEPASALARQPQAQQQRPQAAAPAAARTSLSDRQDGGYAGVRREPPVLREELRLDPTQQASTAGGLASAAAPGAPALYGATPVPSVARAPAWGPQPSLAELPMRAAAPEMGLEMMQELRNVKGLIEERFSAIAFLETLQRSRGSAQLSQKLMDCGYSPGLVRKLVEAMPAPLAAGHGDEMAWATSVLEANLLCADREPAIEDQGGVFALIGSTGVGKTTTTAKIAAGFAAKHGAANLGLITLDAYRIGAHEQLRAYGRILGVPVHTAHDRTSLEDLLELLASKKLVLIDTAGVAQRDTRCKELLDMLGHTRIRKLLLVNVAAQGETIEDVLVSYRAQDAAGVVLSKLDEAVKLAPALDAVIRHKLKIVGVANGQRVPEDWHRLSAQALVHRALRATGGSAWRLDPSEVHLQFIKPAQLVAAASALPAAAL